MEKISYRAQVQTGFQRRIILNAVGRKRDFPYTSRDHDLFFYFLFSTFFGGVF